jgi:hypothetical protein
LASIQSSVFGAIIVSSPKDTEGCDLGQEKRHKNCISAKQIHELKLLVPLSCLYDL